MAGEQAERCPTCDREKALAWHPEAKTCWAHSAADGYNEALSTRQWPRTVDVEFKRYCTATDECRARTVDWRQRCLASEERAAAAEGLLRAIGMTLTIGFQHRPLVDRIDALLAGGGKGEGE